MKVTIEIECTPDEARQFMGLPDVKPMQAALMGRMEAQMSEAADRFSPDALLRSWMSLMPGTPEGMRDVFTRLFQAGTGSGSKG